MAKEHERSYTDREFALILNKAAELSASAESSPQRRAGLSLAEIKAIAVEAGFDPALVDRAAKQLPANSGGSAIERVIGGSPRLELTDHLDVPLTGERAAHLLAIVRATMDVPGEADTSAGAMSWSSSGPYGPVIVTAHDEGDGTRLRIATNRREILALTGMFALTAGVFVPFIAAAALDLESAAAIVALFAGGFGGSLATARAFWSAMTKRWQSRASELMDRMVRTLEQDSEGKAPPEVSDRQHPRAES